MLSHALRALNARRTDVKEGEKGFTLIELLVVVIIIGILAAIAIPVYMGIQNNAKDKAVESDVANAKTAVVAFATDHNGTLPTTTEFADLGTYGYTVPSDANYTTLPTLSLSTDGKAFCISAVAKTSTTVAASDVSGVTSPGGCAAGVITAG